MFKKEITYPSDLLFKEARLFDPRQLFFFHSMLRQQRTKTTLKKNEHVYNTRNKNTKYVPPFMNKSLGQKSYTYLSSRLYGHLPIELQNNNNQNVFKRRLKNFIFSTPRGIIHDIINLKI